MLPPSVLHVVTTNSRRGAERVAVELSEALQSRGWRSGVVALAPRAPGGLGVVVLGRRPRGLSTLRRLRALAAHHDVVVAHGVATLDAVALALVATPSRFVYVNIGDPTYWLTSRLKQERVGRLLRRAALVVAIAPSAAAPLVDWLGVPASAVRTIPNGRDPERFCPATAEQRRAARSHLQLPADAGVVLVLGALSQEKRVDVAVRAVAALPGVRLVVTGDGPLRDDLVELAGRVAPGCVTFTGSVDRPEDVLAAADVVLLTSETEGLPGVVIEAGLAGLPVVASDVGYVADVVVDGRTGLLVEAGDVGAVAEAVGVALRRGPELGHHARLRCVELFSSPTMVAAWDTALRSVVRGSP